MKAKVTDEGVLIPKELLGDAEEVEITAGDGHVVVTPVLSASGESQTDPIWGLGSDPVDDDLTDASTNLDRYVYDPG